MSYPSLAVVEKMYECFNRDDLETIRTDVFAPDIVWNLPGRHPLSGTKRGADEVLAFFDQLRKGGVQVDLDSIDAIDDETVVELHRGHGTAPNGAILDALNCTHYTVKDGKITNVQVFIGEQHSVDGFFWAVYSLKPIPQRLAS